MFLTLVLTSIVFIIYKWTYTGVAYSNNFNVSIVLTGMITAMIMMVIGNNLALSLGMVGALSIVRFRAAIKEPKDISFLFWSISIGLSAGTGALQIAIVGTLFIGFTILAYHLGPSKQEDAYLLIIKGSTFDSEKINAVIKTHTKNHKLRMKNTKNDAKEVIYEIKLGLNEDALIEELHKIDKIDQVNIVTFSGHLNE
jgi:uncharacterized membrane protein YhiD involved in acid resistance